MLRFHRQITGRHVRVLPALLWPNKSATVGPSTPIRHRFFRRDVTLERALVAHLVSSRFFTASTTSGDENMTTESLGTSSIRTDFFGEPVSFFGEDKNVSSSMEALDAFILAVVTKGKSCRGRGGNEEGLQVQAAHSSAMVWADLLRHAAVWKDRAPMLSAAAVAPILAQAHIGYLHALDALLHHTETPISLLSLARAAASVTVRTHPELTVRERLHLEALNHLVGNQRQNALGILLSLLQQCPGDALALSLAMDLASTTGFKNAALQAAGSVASYWQERGWRGLSPAIPGYSVGSSLIALGFAAGGRYGEAEQLADQALRQDVDGSGGVATLALAIAYHAGGRAAEGISLLAGFDGAHHYEGCGLLFFDARLRGYGARFSLDREGVAGGRTALRMYDNCFGQVLLYSGYGQGKPWSKPKLKIPQAISRRVVESAKARTKSLFQGIFGSDEEEVPKDETSYAAEERDSDSATIEDVFTWLPPTPQLLTDATFLLLRLTINGTIESDDERWERLQKAWRAMKETQIVTSDEPFDAMPSRMAAAASLLCDSDFFVDRADSSRHVLAGMGLLGELMHLKEPSKTVEFGSMFEDERKQNWATVTKLLASTLIGSGGPSADFDVVSTELEGWDIDLSPIVDHAICYAACKSEDFACLSIARSRCSQGVSLRPNSPEEWYRYSVVLECLGDKNGAEDARSASISLGLGEGVVQ